MTTNHPFFGFQPPEIDRRAFLRAAGRAGAAALVAGVVRGFPAAEAAGPARAAAAGSPAPVPLADWLAGAVADLEKQAPYAYALYTRDEETRADVDGDGFRWGGNGPREGIVLGVFDGRQFHEEGLSLVTAESVNKLRDRLLARGISRRGPALDPGPALDRSWSEEGRLPIEGLTPAARVERARAFRQSLLKREPGLREVPLSLMTARGERLFVNRHRRLHQVVTRAGVSATLIAGGRGAGAPGVLNTRWIGAGGLEWLEVPEAEIARWLEQAGRLAGAPPPRAGLTTIVSEPQITGTLAHEAIGHGVELDLFWKGRARAADYLDKPVGSSHVTIVDDPSKPGANGFYYFDDEGMTAGPTTIVERGVLKAGLSDAWSAWRLHRPRTANGRREAWDRKVYARMSNTFFAPGPASPEELIGGVTDGLYVAGLEAGIEDPKGWGMQIVAAYGEIIRKGRLTGEVVGPVTLTGYVPELLASVDGVANDFTLRAGTCGKGYKEMIPVSLGGPTLRFKARVS